MGFAVMIGCTVGSSLAMAPAALLARDRPDGLRYEGSLVYPPDATLWG